MAALLAAVSDSEKHFLLAVPGKIGRRYRFDDEAVMLIGLHKAVGSTQWRWTVIRAEDGTVAATHDEGTDVFALAEALVTSEDLDAPVPYVTSGGGGLANGFGESGEVTEIKGTDGAQLVISAGDGAGGAEGARITFTSGDGGADGDGGSLVVSAGDPSGSGEAGNVTLAARSVNVQADRMNFGGTVELLVGVDDPTTGGGVPHTASRPAIYLRASDNTAQLWLSTGDGNTDWVRLEPAG